MTPALTPAPAPHCVLTLDQVDDLHSHAHRVLLYGTLMANGLDDYAVQDGILEGLQALVVETITHAQQIEGLLAQGCRAAEKGGVPR